MYLWSGCWEFVRSIAAVFLCLWNLPHFSNVHIESPNQRPGPGSLYCGYCLCLANGKLPPCARQNSTTNDNRRAAMCLQWQWLAIPSVWFTCRTCLLIIITIDCFSAFAVTSLNHGFAIRGGTSGGEKGSPEETGRHTLSDGWTHSVGARRQGSLHCQPPICRYSLWVFLTLKSQAVLT